MKKQRFALGVLILGLGVMLTCRAAEVTPGAHFEWDAAQDPNETDNTWPSTTANSYNWQFDGGVLAPVSVSDPRLAVTKAYVFPDAKDGGNTSFSSHGSGDPASFEFILKLESGAANGIIFESGATGDGIQFDYISGAIRGYIKESYDTTISYTLAPGDFGRFIDVIFIADQVNDVFQLYVDGDLKDSVAWSNSPWAGSDGAGLGASSGNQANGDTGDFDGQMALFRYYRNKALSDVEVLANFQSIYASESSIQFSDLAASNVTENAASLYTTVNTNLTLAKLVWDTEDMGNTNVDAWAHSLGLGEQSAGMISTNLTGLSADTENFFRFYGEDATTNGWSTVETFATALTAAQTPALTGATPTFNSVTLTWTDNSATETGFVLQRSTNGVDYTSIALVDADATSHVDGGLTPLNTYWYQLAATNDVNESCTAFSVATNATTLYMPPTTTYSGATGTWQSDTWNNNANWSGGVPSASQEAIIAEGEYASVSKKYSGVDTPAYTGSLTLSTNATVEVGDGSVLGDLNALGGSNIYFNTGSDLRLRYAVNSVHPQNFVMLGDAKFTLGTSSSAHHESRTLTGEISGPGKLTTHVSHNNTLYLQGSSPNWSGGIYSGGTEDENKTSRIEAKAVNALGTGDIFMDDGMGLQIDAADAMGDGATLNLTGGDGSLNQKLVMNADDTVYQAFRDGNPLQAGTYGRVGTPATVSYEMNWIGGDSVLTVLSTPADTNTPTVVSMDSPPAATPIYGTPTISYTVTFDEHIDPATVDASDFASAGTAPYTIGSVTNLSVYPYPSMLTVEVTPSGAGTVQLRISGVIEDLAGNALVVPVDDDQTYTLSDTEPMRSDVTVDGITTYPAENGFEFVVDASGSEKLVVVLTGENGHTGSASGKITGLNYDGEPLIQLVNRLPVAKGVDILFNDIWYLDNPGQYHTTGTIAGNATTRATVTAFALSNTAPGAGATAISTDQAKSVELFAAKGSLVIASYGMGGDGNTAYPEQVDAALPLVETSALYSGGHYSGHITGTMLVDAFGLVEPTFVHTRSTAGTHTIAAEFRGVEIVPSGTLILIK